MKDDTQDPPEGHNRVALRVLLVFVVAIGVVAGVAALVYVVGDRPVPRDVPLPAPPVGRYAGIDGAALAIGVVGGLLGGALLGALLSCTCKRRSGLGDVSWRIAAALRTISAGLETAAATTQTVGDRVWAGGQSLETAARKLTGWGIEVPKIETIGTPPIIQSITLQRVGLPDEVRQGVDGGASALKSSGSSIRTVAADLRGARAQVDAIANALESSSG